MDNEAHRKYHFAKRHFDDFNEAIADLQRGGNGARRMVRYWREMLSDFVSSYKAFKAFYVSVGQYDKINRIKDELNSDPILYYLFQARNSEEHVSEAVEGVPTAVGFNIPGGHMNFFSGDNMNMTFRGNVVVDEFGNRHALPNFTGTIHAGKFEGSIDNPSAMTLSAPFLRLLPAKNRGKNFPVPSIDVSEEKKALEFAQCAKNFLERWHSDARSQLSLT